MNEYARLAKAKPMAARTPAEMLGAAWGLDEIEANVKAHELDNADINKVIDLLPRKQVKAKDLIEFIDELRKRKDPQGFVKDHVPTIANTIDVAAHCLELKEKKKEYLMAFFLNARHQLIAKDVISIGTLTASLAHPREIFAPAIGKAAAGVILVHNHPSGDPSPSDEDMRLTKRISQAGHILGIELLDHLIMAGEGSYSFEKAGTL